MKQPKPLTILFDANPLVNNQKSGVGYYTHHVITALAENYPTELRLIGQYFDFLGRRQNPDLPHAPNISYHATKLIPGKAIQGLRRVLGIDIPMEWLAMHKGDVLLFPNFTMRPSLFGAPRIVSIHDLYFIEHPEHINENNLDFLQKFVPKAAKHSSAIITISEFTKQAIEHAYGKQSKPVIVTPIPPMLPLTLTRAEQHKLREEIGVTKDYLLFIGNLEPRKNLVTLITAYRQLPRSIRQQYSLVLAGGKGWRDEAIWDAIDTARRNGENIITPGYISDVQKAALYSGAAAFVFPSYYEGFGMQLCEAMSYHVPLVVSDIPPFHEVADGAAIFCDPHDPVAFENAIKRIITDTAVRKRIIKAGDDRLKQYDWRIIAHQLYTTMREVVRG